VPTPSKFNREIATRIVELLVAGCSRREVARRVGVDHETIARWIRKGDRVPGSGSRFAEFSRAVHLAEDELDPPRLVALRDLRDRYSSWEANPFEAWKFLERTEPGYARRPDPEPVKIEVVLGPTVEGDPA
jgi:transcriptional regulator with XRE-family HTH domain